MQRWEYAEMIVTVQDGGMDEVVLFFSPNVTRVEKLESETNPAVWNNFNNKLAQLGQEGWEVISAYATDNPR